MLFSRIGLFHYSWCCVDFLERYSFVSVNESYPQCMRIIKLCEDDEKYEAKDHKIS